MGYFCKKRNSKNKATALQDLPESSFRAQIWQCTLEIYHMTTVIEERSSCQIPPAPIKIYRMPSYTSSPPYHATSLAILCWSPFPKTRAMISRTLPYLEPSLFHSIWLVFLYLVGYSRAKDELELEIDGKSRIGDGDLLAVGHQIGQFLRQIGSRVLFEVWGILVIERCALGA